MKKNILILLVGVALIALTVNIFLFREQNNSATNHRLLTNAAELDELITEGAGSTLLVDLRDRADFEKGHLPNFLNISWKEDGELFKTWVTPFRRDKQIVLICYGGNRSSRAFQALVLMGFTNITDFSAGYEAYVSQKAGSFIPELGSCDCPE